MKDLWIALLEYLIADSTLVSMTGYTTSTNTISRSNSIEEIKFSDTVTRAVTFQQWTDTRTSESATDNMKDITVLFVCYSKSGDLEAIELSDYLQTLLEGVSLTNSDIHNYYSAFDDFVSPPYYDKDEQVWRVDLRFRFKVALL